MTDTAGCIPYLSVGRREERFAAHLLSIGSAFQRRLPAARPLSVIVTAELDIQDDEWIALSGPVPVGDGTYFQGTRSGLARVRAEDAWAVWRHASGAVDCVAIAPSGAMALDRGTVYAGTRDGMLTAHAIEDGRKLWAVAANDWVSGIELTHDAVVFGSRDGRLRCVGRDGTLRWTTDLGARIFARPCVSEGRVFVGARNGLFYAIAVDSGQILRSLETGSDVHGAAVVAAGHVVFGSDDKRVYCVNPYTLAPVWMFRTGDAVWARPVVGAQRVVVASTDGYVYALNAASGEPCWEMGTGAPVRLGLGLAGESVCVANDAGDVAMIDLLSGSVLGTAHLSGGVWAAPAAGPRGFLVATRSNQVVALAPTV